MKHFSTLASVLLAGVLTIGALPCTAFAEDATAATEDPNTFTDETLTYTYVDGGVSVTACDSGVTDLNIPEYIDGYKILSIGDQAFYSCTKLETLTLPDSITSIGEAAFYGCSALTELTLPSSITTISNGMFGYCYALTSFEVPDTVTAIGDYAFSNCRYLEQITIPDSVTLLGNNSFEYCMNLKTLALPDTIESIGGLCFVACASLPELTLPKSLVNIGELCFVGCAAMERFSIDSSNNAYATNDAGLLLNKAGTRLIAYPAALPDKSFTVASPITEIGYYAFSGAKNLTQIEIPETVSTIGEGAFSGCTGLTSIRLPNSITTISGSLFADCSSLSSFEISPQVTSIDGYAFYCCDALKELTVPDTVTTIGDYAIGYTANDDGESTLRSDFTLHASSDSAAADYAKKAKLTLEATGFNWKLCIVIAGAVLLVALAVVLLARRKGHKQIEAAQAPILPQQEPEIDPNYTAILDEDPDESDSTDDFNH